MVSEERIKELLELMLDNADENGWCYFPEGITDDEGEALTRQLTLITMKERIDELMVGILKTLKFMDDIKSHVGDYDTIDLLKIDGALSTLREDSQNILIDLHSENKVADFFKIDLVMGEGPNAIEEAESVKKLMNELIDVDFKESLDKIRDYCQAIIELTDELHELIKSKK